MRFWKTATYVLLLCIAPLSQSAESIDIELNKLESVKGACRAYLVLTNPAAQIYTSFKLDLVIFDQGGVIAKRLALNMAPIRANKTSVKLFDIKGLKCDDIGRVLINDVVGCRSESGELTGCIAQVKPQSRAGVPFLK